MDNVASLKYFLPEMVLVATVILILLFEMWRVRTLLPLLALAGLVVSMAFCAELFRGGQFGHLFSGMIILDPMALFFKVLFLVATGFTIMFSISHPNERYPQKEVGAEYYALLLISTVGLFCLAPSANLLMMYVSIEMVSISSYILTASLKGNRKSSEAGLKYVIFGAVASGIMIYGLSLIYGLCGQTDFGLVREALARGVGGSPVLLVATIMVMAGLCYKIAAVPFHMWCPDVYEGAPTPITAFLSVAPKAAGFAILIRFFYTVLSVPAGYGEWLALPHTYWPIVLAVISVLTMTIGNLAALWQNNLKRLLAYSSIAHAGYILMGLVLLNGRGITAIMIYLVIYLFMNLGAFLVVIVVSRSIGSEDIKDYKGLGWRSPMIGIVMSIFLFSLTGLPPLAGFIGKLYIFSAVIESQWYVLAVVGVLNSVISLFYYVRIVKAMFLEGIPDKSETPAPLSIPSYYVILLIILVVPVLIFGVYWEPLYNFVVTSLPGIF
ncbi:MAG: NADH-quinone oxidoreductase subunit N [Planctomycetes bacterium]|nr:NADH-quinone oxidoreductase subunit N [Planctomycetota bacterium]